MKILLDENLPRKLKFSFSSEHEIVTVREMNWTGKRNGELLALMTSAGFNAFVTIDKNLQFQQNVNRFPIKLIVFDAVDNKLETLRPYAEKLAEILSLPIDDQVIMVKPD